MKLINKTKIDSKILKRFLLSSAKIVGYDTDREIHIRVNRCRIDNGTRGVFIHCNNVRGQRYGYKKYSEDWHTTNGVIQLWLPLMIPKWWNGTGGLEIDGLKKAESIYRVAMHEFSHAKDYTALENGERLPYAKKINGRRERHDKRPEEIRADNYVYDAEQKIRGRREDIIIDFGIELERVINLQIKNNEVKK